MSHTSFWLAFRHLSSPIKPFMAHGLIWRASCLQWFCLSSVIRQNCTLWTPSIKCCYFARLRSHVFSDAGSALCHSITLKECMAVFSTLRLGCLCNACHFFLRCHLCDFVQAVIFIWSTYSFKYCKLPRFFFEVSWSQNSIKNILGKFDIAVKKT